MTMLCTGVSKLPRRKHVLRVGNLRLHVLGKIAHLLCFIFLIYFLHTLKFKHIGNIEMVLIEYI